MKRKERSPACRTRNAQRMKDFIRKKKLSATLQPQPTTANDKDIDDFISQVQVQNTLLQNKLEHSNKELNKFQELLSSIIHEFQRKVHLADEHESKISQLGNQLEEKDDIIGAQSKELQEMDREIHLLQNDLDYAWNRIYRCEDKIRYLTGQ